MIVSRVPNYSVAPMWRMVEPLLQPALEVSGQTDMDGARVRLLDGTWALWTAAHPGRIVAVAVTEIITHDLGHELLIYAGGSVTGEGAAAVRAFDPIMRQYARHYECRTIKWHGRPGWRRSGMLPRDARHVADVMEVRL